MSSRPSTSWGLSIALNGARRALGFSASVVVRGSRSAAGASSSSHRLVRSSRSEAERDVSPPAVRNEPPIDHGLEPEIPPTVEAMRVFLGTPGSAPEVVLTALARA
ncbi:hypothetical protein WME97_14940 [Sorangium sp. So ce367]|uniref:hypothetical protein n=1 Tax=Sorangium sp. So ce367 TaxID=3133305 RepID=UPI003F61310A